jgi:chromatin assembly factor 1 subunit B
MVLSLTPRPPFPGELLASAGDDGNVILWVRSETHHPAFGSDGLDDKETWRTKHMCRSLGTEIYDLAWSPDATFFIIGSMDNVARIYNAGTGRTCYPETCLGKVADMTL